MRHVRGRLVAALAWLVAAAPSFAGTPAPVDTLSDGRIGKIYLGSLTPKNPIEMVKRQSTAKVVVDGVLSLPAEAKGPVPAMVIAHGSGGILPSYALWTAALNRAGIATFVVDSWGGRGITSTRYDQSQVSNAANVADAFFALRLLATHPRIDAKRIGVMGFSPQPFLAPVHEPAVRLLARFGAAEERLRREDPTFKPATGSEPPAIAIGGAR